MNNKIITIVVCTYNRANLLRKALLSLAQQTVQKTKYKVIVVDNNSKEDIKKIVKEFSGQLNIEYVTEKDQGLAHARNRGWEESDSEYVAFMDDDAKADKNWLKAMIEI